MQNHCSYCYTLGHNKRTCPDLTKNLENNAAAGCDYSERQLATRGKGKAGSNRTCSFCGHKGHDRRTCVVLNTFIEKDSIKISEARADFVQKMKDKGFGIGTLVGLKEKAYNYKSAIYEDVTRVGIVTNISWNEISHRLYDSPNNIVEVQTIKDGTPGKSYYSLPFDILEKDENSASSYWVERCPTILNPVEEFKDPPSGFFHINKCAKISKEFTRDKKSWSFGIESD